ncbi:MAG: hypothetical protein FJX77_17685, partial [Armatimonadetes bacterium]|nr:hypothetical protein [Armatimonadota bacterium]
ALVNGRVVRPNGTVAVFPFFDDGLAIHNDQVARDGVYGARFDRYGGDGVYRFEITVTNVDGTTFGGEDFGIGLASQARPAPMFVRTVSTSALVTGVPAIPRPNAPTELRVTGTTANSVSLGWMDNSADEDGFEIQRDSGGGFQTVGRVGPGTPVFTDIGLPLNTTHRYRVRAFNAGGDSDFTNEVEAVTLPNPPEAPDQLTAQPVGRTQVRLNWRDRSNNETGFKIQRRDPGGDFVEIGTAGENATTFTDETADPNVRHTYRVVATNAGGDSSASNEANALIRTGGFLLVAPGVLDFGPVQVGTTAVANVVLENDSADRLTVVIQIPASPFSIPRFQRFVIPPFGMREVEVRCSPRSRGGYNRLLRFKTNSPRTPTLDVRLLGRGVR